MLSRILVRSLPFSLLPNPCCKVGRGLLPIWKNPLEQRWITMSCHMTKCEADAHPQVIKQTVSRITCQGAAMTKEGVRKGGGSKGVGEDKHGCTENEKKGESRTELGSGIGGGTLTCPNCGYQLELCVRKDLLRCDACSYVFMMKVNRTGDVEMVNMLGYVNTEDGADYAECDEDDQEEEGEDGKVTPEQIYYYLGQYVVGQEEARKWLAVATYNHYRRVSRLGVRRSHAAESLAGAELVRQAQRTTTTTMPMRLGPSVMQTSAGAHAAGRREGEEVTEFSMLLHYLDMVEQERRARNAVRYKRERGDATAEEEEKGVVQKSNVLMLGPTGSGKTLLAETMAKCLRVPFALCDCTGLTAYGYVGEDVNSVVSKLLVNAGGDVARAEQGVIFLDEVDKIAHPHHSHHSKDIGGEAVQQGLLKMIEGSKVEVTISTGNKKKRGQSKERTVEIDTTNILFVASGAFVNLHKIIRRRVGGRRMGFANAGAEGGSEEMEDDPVSVGRVLRQVQACDLVNYGMIPEFVGRFQALVPIEGLSRDHLVQLLTQPINAPTVQYERMFDEDGCELVIEEEALLEIANEAVRSGVGARGLRAILDRLLLQAQFDVPSANNITKVVVDRECVTSRGKKLPTYVYEKNSAS